MCEMKMDQSEPMHDRAELMAAVDRYVTALADHLLSGAEANMGNLIPRNHEYRVALVEQHIPSCLRSARWPIARSIALSNPKK
jgi:hypothetical protein